MLNKGLRDEKKVKIDKMLTTLLSLVFVPKFWNAEDTSLIDDQLTEIHLSTANLQEISEEDLITLLSGYGFDWDDKERFADFMVSFSKENDFNLASKSVALYEHIQAESKAFSFGISTKIATTKAYL